MERNNGQGCGVRPSHSAIYTSAGEGEVDSRFQLRHAMDEEGELK